MAKLIKFDMPIDGVKVATLEALRDHFTTEVVGHFRSGLLARWLRSRDMETELEAIGTLTVGDDAGILRGLCHIFNVEADDDAIAAAIAEATGVAGVRPQGQNALPDLHGPDTARPGETSRDAPTLPELVVVPAGRFMMGQLDGAQRGHEVRIDYPLAVGVYPVTFDEWDACVSDGGCGGYRPPDNGWGRENRPVINVSWGDAKMYVWWLSWKTGKGYRLLSESEWEYCARAGTKTLYWWGNEIGRDRSNCRGSPGGRYETSPVGSFSPNAYGLYDVHGNVNEWVEDHWASSYYTVNFLGERQQGLTNGGARQGGDFRRVVRGGSWKNSSMNASAISRRGRDPNKRSNTVGFRVARTLAP